MIEEQEFIRFMADTRYSRIPSEFPDEKCYKKYYSAEKIEIILHKGDCLYIPSDWFHFVFSEETSGKHNVNLAVNFWYKKTRDYSGGIQPCKSKHDITVDLDVYKDDIVTVTESSCSFFLANHLKLTNFFEHIDITEYKSTMSKFIRKRNPYTYIQQNVMKYSLKPPDNSIEGELILTNFWINFGKVNSQLHCDGYDNMLCQVEGTKRIILFNPNQRDNLYLYNNYSSKFVKTLEDKICSSTIDSSFVLYSKNTPVSGIMKTYTLLLTEKKVLIGNHISNKGICNMNIKHSTVFKNENTSQYSLFFIEEGYGTLFFRDGSKYELLKGDSIIFPDSIFYQYRLETSDIKITYYPINYNNLDNYNKNFLDIFAKEDESLENIPSIIAEANRLFKFELFGNKIKYDMIIDSQSKLWVLFIKNGVVKIRDKEYTKKNTIIVIPIYIPVQYDGDIVPILVQGPPFK